MSVWRRCVFVEHVFNVLVMGTLETCPMSGRITLLRFADLP